MFRLSSLNNLLVRLLGWPATVLHGDPSIFDRWLWLRRRLVPGDVRTLEAGCGSGAFTLYAARLGNEAVGVSFDSRNNEVAGQRAQILGLDGVRFVTGDLREVADLAADLGAFDQIICCETIEHILDDQQLISGLADMLNPGGRLLITTPSAEHRAMRNERLSTTEDGGHVRYGYTHEDLRRLLLGAGLEVVSLGYVTGVISQLLVRLQIRLARVHPGLGWLAGMPFRGLQTLDPFIARWSTYPAYCVTAVGIRRPAPD